MTGQQNTNTDKTPPRPGGAGVDWYFDPNDPDDNFRLWGNGENFPRLTFDPRTGTIKAGVGLAPPTTIGSGGTGSSVLIEILATDPHGSAIVATEGIAYYTVPVELNGWIVTSVQIALTQASSAGAVIGQLRNVTRAADVLSTRATIDQGALNSYISGAGPSVVDGAHNTLGTGDLLACDLDSAGASALGLMYIISAALP